MPLDPMIANPAPVKLADPMEQYNNYLLAATRKGEMRKAKREEESLNALNAAFAVPGAINPDGSYNLGVISNALAKSGVGAAIPGQYEQHLKHGKLIAETGHANAQAGLEQARTVTEGFTQKEKQANVIETQAKTRVADANAFKQEFDNAKGLLAGISPDPKIGVGQWKQWVSGVSSHPTLGPALVQFGMTPDKLIAQADVAAQQGKFQDFLKMVELGVEKASEMHYEVVNTQDRMVTKAMPKYQIGGKPVVTDANTEVVGKDPNAAARAPKTNVYNNVTMGLPAVNSFQEAAGTTMGKDFADLVKVNKGFEQQVAGIDRALDVLDSGALIAGAGAKPKLDAVRIAKALGAKVDDKTLQNTEMLQQQIATSVFNRISALKASGVALTPMSNSDLQKIEAAGPQLWNDPGTIKRLFLIEREAVQNARRLYNDQAKHYAQTPMTSNAVQALGAAPMAEIAPRRSGGIPQGAIDYLRKHPETAAVFEKKYKLPPGSAKRYLGGHQ